MAVVGAGIVGCATAAFLAEAGLAVTVYERQAVAAGASGRNQGVVQHPWDPMLSRLHADTIACYRELAVARSEEFSFPTEPNGLLLLSRDPTVAEATARDLRRSAPELDSEHLDPAAVRRLEPMIAGGISGCRVATGYAVRPGAATAAYASLARNRGARCFEGTAVRPWIRADQCLGVRGAVEKRGRRHDLVVLTAGAWSAGLLTGTRVQVPVRPLWGVVASVRLDRPPHHVLEEVGVDDIGLDDPAKGPDAVSSVFSLVTSDGASSVGASRMSVRPVEADVARVLLERGAAFIPELDRAPILGARSCPRPISRDGRPLLGWAPTVEGLMIAVGHGPWGISTGPGSARLIADLILGREATIPAELLPSRFT